MEVVLYTVHSRGRTNEVRVVGDRRHRLGVVPPVWALWRGLWIAFVVIALVLAAALVVQPAIFWTLWLGLAVLATLEGAAIERLELRLRGWRELGVVEARTPEGAEELFLTGRAAVPA